MLANPTRVNLASPTTSPLVCLICGGSRLHYLFSVGGARVVRCQDCQLMLRDQRTSDVTSGPAGMMPREERAAHVPVAIAPALAALERYRGRTGGRLLAIARRRPGVRRGGNSPRVGRDDACPHRSRRHRNAARRTGFSTWWPSAMCSTPCRIRVVCCSQARAQLLPGGVLFVASFAFDRWNVRPRKTIFRAEQSFYFTRATLETLLIRSGFREIIVRSGLSDPADGLVFLARAGGEAAAPRLSLVVPVFNEARTFATNFEKLLAKKVVGLEIEIIVVESNSTDGTRDLVGSLRRSSPGDRGLAGSSARQGTRPCARDWSGSRAITCLIQDADLEYDLEDYEALLEPLLHGQAAFVLGARHGGSAWKMRSFTGQPVMSAVLNGAHWFFTVLVNIGFGAHLKDPFTMYKVFRRDCLYGLDVRLQPLRFRLRVGDQAAAQGLPAARDPGELPLALVRGGQEGFVLR